MHTLEDLTTPALLVDLDALDHNNEVMARARPGRSLRPHVKAFKSTALARHLHGVGGHDTFCCATLREMEGMVAAGLHTDLLLANETLDAPRLAALVASSPGIVTVAVDSPETVSVAAEAGASVLIDVDVGLPRCGCPPEQAGPLAELARSLGVEVRGVMGYEGHAVGVADRARRTTEVAASMSLLQEAHRAVGGGLSSAGGTGTYDLHDWVDEVQAGSYLLMDTAYAELGLPFRSALSVLTTVISTSTTRGWGVVDAGLKAFGMDHGNPSMPGWSVLFCSDEHTTFCPVDGGELPAVGTRLRMLPAHVDPTVAYHEQMYVLRGDRVVDTWPVDLRGW